MPRHPLITALVAVLALASLLAGCSADNPVDPGDSPLPPVYQPEGSAFHAWDPADFAVVLDVGPGRDLAEPGDVPWESLAPSTLVRIHSRLEPYRAKWVVNTAGTEDRPVVILGVPDPISGARPVISGDGAVTRVELSYWNEDRSVVKIGGSNLPSDDVVPAWVYLQGLEIRSGRPGYRFTSDSEVMGFYGRNAAAVHVEIGAHITIENCILTDCGNGLFAGSQVSDLQVRGNHIHANGIENSIYEHNSYTECLGILFEFNRCGPLRDTCGGNNLKDRSAGTVIRYNWIEGGNRQLDLVETDHAELRDDSRYRTTFVYGNLLIEPDGAGNSQIVHYGGDGGDASWYRKGTLHFYHNTVLSLRSGNTTLLRLSSSDETAEVRNCAVHAMAGESRLAISNDAGTVTMARCWLTQGWQDSHSGSPSGTVAAQDCTSGDDPGFENAGAGNLEPAGNSPLLELGGPLATAAAAHPVTEQYRAHQDGQDRTQRSAPAAGALER